MTVDLRLLDSCGIETHQTICVPSPTLTQTVGGVLYIDDGDGTAFKRVTAGLEIRHTDQKDQASWQNRAVKLKEAASPKQHQWGSQWLQITHLQLETPFKHPKSLSNADSLGENLVSPSKLTESGTLTLERGRFRFEDDEPYQNHTDKKDISRKTRRSKETTTSHKSGGKEPHITSILPRTRDKHHLRLKWHERTSSFAWKAYRHDYGEAMAGLVASLVRPETKLHKSGAILRPSTSRCSFLTNMAVDWKTMALVVVMWLLLMFRRLQHSLSIPRSASPRTPTSQHNKAIMKDCYVPESRL
jgi:hypothetical protein